MKFKNITATVAMVALLCGGGAAHAQTMSGKGIDTSATNGYGAQLQLDEVKAQQVVNTAAITMQGEQLEDVNGRLDGIDSRLDQISEQINDLSNSMKTIQKTLTQVTSKTETLEAASDVQTFKGCNNSSKPEASTNKPCAAQFFRCPSSETTTSGGAWASFGCIGQLSSLSQCVNIVYANHGLNHWKANCTPVSIVVK